MKVGVFGGLFDPPHTGHLVVAQWIKEEFDLDKIVFVPSGNPPHKNNYAPYEVRYKMTKLATKGNKNFIVSDIEKKIPGKTYTVEVINAINKHNTGIYPRMMHAELFLIIGADQWNEIDTWKDPKSLFRACRVIVVPRFDYAIRKMPPLYQPILASRCPLINISSTMVRKMVKKGLNIRYLVPEPVFYYIKKHKLYR